MFYFVTNKIIFKEDYSINNKLLFTSEIKEERSSTKEDQNDGMYFRKMTLKDCIKIIITKRIKEILIKALQELTLLMLKYMVIKVGK